MSIVYVSLRLETDDFLAIMTRVLPIGYANQWSPPKCYTFVTLVCAPRLRRLSAVYGGYVCVTRSL
jgi:hypothetical protein